MKPKNKNADKIRLIAILIISILVLFTGILFGKNSFAKGDAAGGILGAIIALSILAFAVFAFRRGNRDLKDGYPLHDERSKKVFERATSKAFYVSIYMLLAIGFLSDSMIKFRDVSQATSVAIGVMVILFLIFWVYYNKKEL